MGANFSSKVIDLPGTQDKMKLQIWDTAGQEVYRSITPIYYRDAAAAICVFDVTDAKSLESAERWIKDLRENAPRCIQIILAANKCDLYEKQQVSDQETQAFAVKHNLAGHQITSAKENIGVDRMFLKVAQKITENKEQIVSFPLTFRKKNSTSIPASPSRLAKDPTQKRVKIANADLNFNN